MIITITDRVLREIGIIELIFTAQYSKYDETEPFHYILDHTGRSGINGRYIAALDVFSDAELFDLQLYKQHFTERFEGSTNHSLLKNQLTNIKVKAEKARDFYNNNLTAKNGIAKEYVEKKKELERKKKFREEIGLFEKHCAVVTISHYSVMELYLGASRTITPCRTDKYIYSYISGNYILASFCQKLIDFINSIGIGDNHNSEVPALEKIFDADKEGYIICLELFKELEFVDYKGETNPKLKASEIIGLIDAIKQTKHNLFSKESQKRTFNELMQIFQAHLKLPYTPNTKRRNVGFENTKRDALKLIDSYMKKARA